MSPKLMGNTESQIKTVQKIARRIRSKRRGRREEKERVEEENLHFRISCSNFT